MDHLQTPTPGRQVKPTDPPREAPARCAAVPSSQAEAGQAAAALMRRYPGSLVWFGNLTGRWWAFARIRGAWTLLEKHTADEVANALAAEKSSA